MQSDSQLVRVRCLAQGHHDTLGGAGDRTSNPPITSQPALPPELHAAYSPSRPLRSSFAYRAPYL